MGSLTDRVAGKAKRIAGRATGNSRLERRGRRQERRGARRRRVHRRARRAGPPRAQRPRTILRRSKPMQVVTRTVAVERRTLASWDDGDEPSDRR